MSAAEYAMRADAREFTLRRIQYERERNPWSGYAGLAEAVIAYLERRAEQRRIWLEPCGDDEALLRAVVGWPELSRPATAPATPRPESASTGREPQE